MDINELSKLKYKDIVLERAVRKEIRRLNSLLIELQTRIKVYAIKIKELENDQVKGTSECN